MFIHDTLRMYGAVACQVIEVPAFGKSTSGAGAFDPKLIVRARSPVDFKGSSLMRTSCADTGLYVHLWKSTFFHGTLRARPCPDRGTLRATARDFACAVFILYNLLKIPVAGWSVAVEMWKSRGPTAPPPGAGKKMPGSSRMLPLILYYS
jgi:hypothetical protein